LEKVGETKRVVELREELKQIDLNFDKRVALLEFLLYHYKKQVPEFLSKPQGNSIILLAFKLAHSFMPPLHDL